MFANNIILSNIVFVRNKFNRKVSYQPKKFIFRQLRRKEILEAQKHVFREFGSNSLNLQS